MTKIRNTEMIATKLLKPYKKNQKKHTQDQLDRIRKSIELGGFVDPIIVNNLNEKLIIAGHARHKVALQMGIESLPVVSFEDLSENDQKAFRILHNKSAEAEWNFSLLKEEFINLKAEDYDLDLTGFNFDEINEVMVSEAKREFNENYKGTKLVEDFLFPPFSVLNARVGEWQKRKSEWYKFIPSPETTREGVFGSDWMLYHINKGASLLDPVLAELMFLWFCPEEGMIFDPMAGGTEPCVVAGVGGFNYKGIELRQEQVDFNLKIAEGNNIKDKITYYCDDGINLDKHIKPESVDFLFSCPPYYDLEKYSNLKEDLSNLSVEEFDKKYFEIIKKATKTLKNNRFACFIVGEVRDKQGKYLHFVPKTIKAFEEAGLTYYNELILITALASLPIRVRRSWEKNRKIGKTHQNVLIFYKGDLNKIKDLKFRKINYESKNME